MCIHRIDWGYHLNPSPFPSVLIEKCTHKQTLARSQWGKTNGLDCLSSTMELLFLNKFYYPVEWSIYGIYNTHTHTQPRPFILQPQYYFVVCLLLLPFLAPLNGDRGSTRTKSIPCTLFASCEKSDQLFCSRWALMGRSFDRKQSTLYKTQNRTAKPHRTRQQQ